MGFLKEKYCAVGECNELAEPAHLISRANLPKALWDNEAYILPLCRVHHSLQHNIGIEKFCSVYGFELELSIARKCLKEHCDGNRHEPDIDSAKHKSESTKEDSEK